MTVRIGSIACTILLLVAVAPVLAQATDSSAPPAPTAPPAGSWSPGTCPYGGPGLGLGMGARSGWGQGRGMMRSLGLCPQQNTDATPGTGLRAGWGQGRGLGVMNGRGMGYRWRQTGGVPGPYCPWQ